MIWIFVALLAAASFAAMVRVLKLPRRMWELVGAALLVGVAGYALQGSPGQAGSPKAPLQTHEASAAALVAERQKLGSSASAGQPNQWQIISDALARHGQFAEAAAVLQGATAQNPRNADAWLAMGNALVGHAEGFLSPAALHAYRKAGEADPGHPGPPFFLGAALIQSGRIAEGRALWAELLARSPAEAPWRADLAARLTQLDAMLAQQQAQGPAR